MSDWSSWSSCSVTCGEGTKSRTRTCNGPAKSCVGEQQQVHECNGHPDECNGHPDYDILMHKPGHCSGIWTEWSDHTGLDDTSIQCSSPFRVFPAILSSPLSVDVRDKTYKHDWRVTGNVLVHFIDGEWFFGISDRDFSQGFTKKKRTPSISLVEASHSILNHGPCNKISKLEIDGCDLVTQKVEVS